MSFSDITFGKCPVCGYDGADDTSASGADASSSDAGNGVELVYYNGKLMCEVCKTRLSSDEESKLSARKHSEEERFRSKAGFRHSLDSDD